MRQDGSPCSFFVFLTFCSCLRKIEICWNAQLQKLYSYISVFLRHCDFCIQHGSFVVDDFVSTKYFVPVVRKQKESGTEQETYRYENKELVDSVILPIVLCASLFGATCASSVARGNSRSQRYRSNSGVLVYWTIRVYCPIYNVTISDNMTDTQYP